MNNDKSERIDDINDEIFHEIVCQDLEWGTSRTFPDTNPNYEDTRTWQGVLPEKDAKRLMNYLASLGEVSWSAILTEEIAEAYTPQLWEDRRKELVQCAAVIVQWILDGDTR